MVRFVHLLLDVYKKFYLFPNAGGKRVTVFQNVGLQFGDVLTLQMVYHHKMQPMTFSMMPSTVEGSDLAVYHILIGACPQMEDPVNRMSHLVVGMAIANQVVWVFFQILRNHRHYHPSHLLVSRTATFSVGKIEQEVEHAMIAHLRHLHKMKHIETTRGIVKLHRRIASSP